MTDASGEYTAFAQEEELGDFRGTAFAKVPRDRHKWALEHTPILFSVVDSKFGNFYAEKKYFYQGGLHGPVQHD